MEVLATTVGQQRTLHCHCKTLEEATCLRLGAAPLLPGVSCVVTCYMISLQSHHSGSLSCSRGKAVVFSIPNPLSKTPGAPQSCTPHPSPHPGRPTLWARPLSQAGQDLFHPGSLDSEELLELFFISLKG